MNKHFIHIIVLILTCYTSKILSQEETYNVQIENASFVELVALLETKFETNFSYSSDLLKDQAFSLKTNNPNLGEILDEVCAIYKLEYFVLSDVSVLIRQKLETTNTKTQSYPILIQDALTNDYIPNVAIGINRSNKGIYSNDQGITYVNSEIVKPGDTLHIYALGYQRTSIAYKNDLSSIKLRSQEFNIEEILVTEKPDQVKKGNNQQIILRATHISSLTSGLAGNDIMRQIQLLPGVASYDDVSAGIKIRGSKEETTLVVFDEMPIYDATHYYGLFSSINPTFAVNSELFKNNLPLEYEGKTSGMVKINGANEIPDKIKGNIQLNALTAAGTFDIPITNNLGVRVGARRTIQNVSNTDFFSLFKNDNNVTIEEFDDSTRDKLLQTIPSFDFSDVNLNINYHLHNNKFAFNYYRSDDNYEESLVNSFRVRRQRVNIKHEESYQKIEQWNNSSWNFTSDVSLGKYSKLKSVLYRTDHATNDQLNISLTRTLPNENGTTNGYKNSRANSVRDVGLKSMFVHKKDFLTYSAGIELIDHDLGLFISEQEETIRNDFGSEGEYSAFASIKKDQPIGFNYKLGLRATQYDQNLYSSPRLDLTYVFGKDFSIKGAYGRHNQFVRQLSFENIFGRSIDFWAYSQNDGLKVATTDQVMLGGTWTKSRFTFDFEMYYKASYNLIELAIRNPRLTTNTIFPLSQQDGINYIPFTGKGRSFGVDILASVTEKNFSGWLSYTWSKTSISYDRIFQELYFPSPYDRRHQLNLIGEYNFKGFIVGANFNYASGRPYTDLNKIAQQRRREELRPDERVSFLPAYIRTDLGVSKKIKLDHMDFTVGVSVYNLLNRQNVNYIQYLFSVEQSDDNQPTEITNELLGTESNLLDRTINLNLGLRF